MALQASMRLFGLSVLCLWIAGVAAQKGVQLRGKLGPTNNAFGVVSVNTAVDAAVPGNFQYQFWISVGGVKDILQVLLLEGESGPVVLDFDSSGQLQLNKTLNVGVTAIGGASKNKTLAAKVEASPGSYYVAVRTAAGYVLQGPLSTTGVEPFSITSSLAGSNVVPPSASAASGAATLTVEFSGNAGADIKYAITSTVTGVTAAGIYKGAAGTSAPTAFVDLGATDLTGTALNVKGCLAAEIVGNPSAFYLNIQTAAAPQGALRGPLVPAYNITTETIAPAAAPLAPVSAPVSAPNALPPVFAPAGTPPTSDPITSGTGDSTLPTAFTSILGTGTGAGFAVFQITSTPSGYQLTYVIAVGGVNNITQLHIHDGAAGATGPKLINFPEPTVLSTTGQIKGTIPIANSSLATSIQTNPANYYVNIHTVESPGGALRGQLAIAADYAVTLAATLTVDAEVDVNPKASSGSGTATIILSFSSASLEPTTKFFLMVQGDLNLTAAHIHSGGATVSGPVFINIGTLAPIDFKKFTMLNNVNGGLLLNATTMLTLIANPANFYVNVHSSSFPNGFVRGQLSITSGTGDASAPAPAPTPASASVLSRPSATMTSFLLAMSSLVLASLVSMLF